MIWEGEEIVGHEKIIETALKLRGKKQKEFVYEFAKTGPYALSNIGYCSGYYDEKTAKKIMKVFKTTHPIFGNGRPTPEQAFAVGKLMGALAKRRDR